jgi:hypothetical protein
MANFALIWKCRDHNDEAVELICVQLQKKILGVEHPHPKSSLSTLNKWEMERLLLKS